MNFHEDFVLESHPTGSNYICNPPVTNTDIDTVFLAKPDYQSYLIAGGWTPSGNYDMASFTSWRKGNKNYIVTTDIAYYRKYVKATKICKALNLLHKQDRIFVFEIVMEGKHLPSNYPPLPDYLAGLNPCAEALFNPT